MPRHRIKGYVPHDRKPEVKRHLKNIDAQVRGRGRCLYVIDDNGKSCGNLVTNNCHVIPKNAVLDELKDGGGNKVFELRWGVGKWQDLFLRSSESNQIKPANLDVLEPQLVGTGDACVRWFACKDEASGKDHDGEFSPIDVREPNFHDPTIRLLAAYRPLLYTLDLMKLAFRLSRQANKRAMSQSNRRARIEWSKQQAALKEGRKAIEQSASRLGKMWHDWKTNRTMDCDAISWKSLNFHSSLKFAACTFYGQSVVTVVPVGQDRHKMTILYFREDTDSMHEHKQRLSEVTRASEDNCSYEVDVLKELLTKGEGTVAASPESYRTLTDEQRQTINAIVARSSRADMMETILGL